MSFTRIKTRRDTAANWTSADPTLLDGEPGFEHDTGRSKVGDGTSAWSALPYSGGLPAPKTAQFQINDLTAPWSSAALVWDNIGTSFDTTENALVLPEAKLYVVRADWLQAISFAGGDVLPTPVASMLYDVNMQVEIDRLINGALGNVWAQETGALSWDGAGNWSPPPGALSFSEVVTSEGLLPSPYTAVGGLAVRMPTFFCVTRDPSYAAATVFTEFHDAVLVTVAVVG